MGFHCSLILNPSNMKKSVLVLIVLFGIGTGIAMSYTSTVNACGFWSSCNEGTTAQTVTDNQKKLEAAVPLPQLDNSLERANISKRLTLFSDPAKISYIYLTSYGKVMAFYTVKGKITSGSKRLTAQSVSVEDCGNIFLVGHSTSCSGATGTVEQPELDGTYGSSAPYIFFWTTDGTYVQWNGEYMLADQPLKLSTQPELIRSIK